MSYYYVYHLGVQDKNGMVYPLGPYDRNGKYKEIICNSRTYNTELHGNFSILPREHYSDQLKKEMFTSDYDDLAEWETTIKYGLLDDIPKGDYVKRGFFLIKDIEEYLADQSCVDLFYDYIPENLFAIKSMNEILYGSNSKTCDDEGYEIETHSCKDYAYFSYPDYISKEYDAFLLRTMAGILVPYDGVLKDGEKIVVLETEG